MNWREAIKECAVHGDTINVEKLADEIYRALHARLCQRHAREEAQGKQPERDVLRVIPLQKQTEEFLDDWRYMIWRVMLRLDLIEFPPDHEFDGQNW
jgi:hypothetical protein